MAARRHDCSSKRSLLAGQNESDTIDKIAQLAKVPDEYREYFACLASYAIREVPRATPVKVKRLPTEKVVEQLDRLTSSVRVLRKKLLAIDPRGMPLTPAALAGKFLRAALNDEGMKFENYLDHLSLLELAAETATKGARLKKGRPGGIQTTFDAFIYSLLDAARLAGGNLTIFKSAHARTGWDGTLLNAVNLLKPLLPERFVPSKVSGSSLHRIKALHAQHRENTRARP